MRAAGQLMPDLSSDSADDTEVARDPRATRAPRPPKSNAAGTALRAADRRFMIPAVMDPENENAAASIPADVLVGLRERFAGSPERVRALLDEVLAAGGPVGVAFSGGPDSLFLLLWLRAWYPAIADRATALHFDHRTRGREGERESSEARAVAGRLGYRFVSGRREIAGPAPEAELRRERFAFLEREMESRGIRVLLLGHQADDVAESFLARAAAGSGPEGLAAPRPVSVQVRRWEHRRARPLLAFRAESIRSFLAETGFEAARDPSNQSDLYLRNRLRRSVLPAWREAADKEVLAGVGRSRALLEETADFVAESVAKLLPGGFARPALPVARLAGAHPACVRFAVQRWLAWNEMAVSPVAFETILRAIRRREDGRWSAGNDAAGADRRIVLADGRLEREIRRPPPRWEPVRWSAGSTLFLPGGASLRRRILVPDCDLEARLAAGEVDPRREAFLRLAGAEGAVLAVRRRRPGDRYRPLGAPGSRKLQDCLVDRKISARERDRLPVVEHDGRILWAPGLPPAEECRWPGGAARLLGLTYEAPCGNSEGSRG